MATPSTAGGGNRPTEPEEIELMIVNRHSGSSPGVIIGAVTATESISSSLLNLDYPVFAVLALSFWNLLFIAIVLLVQLKIESEFEDKWEDLIQTFSHSPLLTALVVEWLPIFPFIAVMAHMFLLFTTQTVKKPGCMLLVLVFLLSLLALVTLIVIYWDTLTQILNGECNSKENSMQCTVQVGFFAFSLAINYSVGSAFLWRKPYQKSIRQLCCPPTKEEALEVMSAPAAAPDVMSAPAAAPGVMSALAAVPDVMSAPAAFPDVMSAPAAVPDGMSAPAAVPDVMSPPAAAPDVMSAPAAAPGVMSAPAADPGVMSAPAAAPDIMFVDHTLSLVVKMKGPDRITGLKLHVSYDSASEDNIENADQNMRVEIIELTKKRPNSEFGVPKELIYVGSVELGKLLTNTSYIGRVVDDGPLAGETFKFITLDKNGNHSHRGQKRIVKLGRKWLVKSGCCLCCAHHWAVQVLDNDQDGGDQVAEKADFWYEVDHKETLFALPKIRINKAENKQRRMFMPCLPCCRESNTESTESKWHSCLPCKEPSAKMGCFDERDAGCCGGETVGKTSMTDIEIEVFYENWSKDKRYFVATTNCIKFAYEIIEKLTDGKFLITHSNVVAANNSENSRIGGTCIKWDEGHGTALSRFGAGDTRFTLGLFGVLRCRFGPEFKAHVLAGRSGLGVFLNLSCNRVELSFGLPWIGGDIHADINLNTGVGARNGNFELHLFGFGGKVGTDGIEINTPWYGGYNVGAAPVLLHFYLLFGSYISSISQ